MAEPRRLSRTGARSERRAERPHRAERQPIPTSRGPNAGGPNAATRAPAPSKGGPNAARKARARAERKGECPGTARQHAGDNQPGARGSGNNQGAPATGNSACARAGSATARNYRRIARARSATSAARASRGFGNNRLGPRGFTNREPRLRAVNAATPQLRQVQRFTHRTEMFAMRARMPRFPLPGERNFTGVPPAGETRFVAAEMVCQWGAGHDAAAIEEIARQHDLTILAIQRSALTGGTLVHFRIGGNRATADVVRAMEAERIVSQPNYVYLLGQSRGGAGRRRNRRRRKSGAGTDDQQYVANKLRLAEVHKIATGKDVMVAVIDSEIDRRASRDRQGHRREVRRGRPARPAAPHGTGMAGAIVSQDRLIGVAPGARTLAVHAFSTGARSNRRRRPRRASSPGSNGRCRKGARIINMSFAGPHDPILALAPEEGVRERRDPDRRGRQCRAEVAAALSRRPTRTSSA